MRSAKESGCFPYTMKQVCYIEINPSAEVVQIANSKTEITAAYKRAINNQCAIFGVWPGQWRSDLFIIDDLNALADAFGITRI